MIKNPIYRLYVFAGLAFVFALVKYFFVEAEISPKFFLLEVVSFGLFIAIIFLADKLLKEASQNEENYKEELDKQKFRYEDEIDNLKSKLSQSQNEDKLVLNNDELNKVADNIINRIKKCESVEALANELLCQMAKCYEVMVGVCYFNSEPSDKFNVKATFGIGKEVEIADFMPNEGLNGQVVSDMKPMLVDEIDEDYLSVESGSGSSKPVYLYLLPVVKNNQSIGLIEVASFSNIKIDQHWVTINNRIADTILL
ncbi:hypothetical protein E9993_05565 [Labilibacter sediminis]|nr:hypothetical protein E9993_05565 [Labilibacter sediminis]